MTAFPDDVQPWNVKPDLDESRSTPKVSKVCVAVASTGFACHKKPIPGGNVCEAHGGRGSSAKRSAQLRLAMLYDPVVATLAREMTTADKSADRIRAAEILLKRIVPERVEISTEDAREVLRERLYQMIEAQPTEETQ
mgnify:FL=1